MVTGKPDSSSRRTFDWRNGLPSAPRKVRMAIGLICLAFLVLLARPRLSVPIAAIGLFPFVYEGWKIQAAREVPLSKNRRVLRTISLAALWVGIVAAALLIKHFFHVGDRF
jgi:hypothetical protein